jgi:hypothetical protein
MKSVDLERRGAGTLVVDMCDECQVFWFDPMESPQLSPAAELFRAVNDSRPQVRGTLPRAMRCPRCDSPLALTGPASLLPVRARPRGRLTPFFQFLREKDFIRPLPNEQLDRLKSLVKVIRCSSCGAPIDLAKSTACEFCRAPIAILDPEAASRAVRELTAAEAKMAPGLDDPARAAAAVMATANFERTLARGQAQAADGFDVAIVAVCLSALAAVMTSR